MLRLATQNGRGPLKARKEQALQSVWSVAYYVIVAASEGLLDTGRKIRQEADKVIKEIGWRATR